MQTNETHATPQGWTQILKNVQIEQVRAEKTKKAVKITANISKLAAKRHKVHTNNKEISSFS